MFKQEDTKYIRQNLNSKTRFKTSPSISRMRTEDALNKNVYNQKYIAEQSGAMYSGPIVCQSLRNINKMRETQEKI